MRHGLAGKESHLSILPDAVSGLSRLRAASASAAPPASTSSRAARDALAEVRALRAAEGGDRSHWEWNAANMIAVSRSTISSLGSLTSTLSR